MFRNEEFKSIVIKLIILQLVFTLIGFMVINLILDNINSKIIDRDIALVGNIIKNHPELKEELISYITKEISIENQNIGKEVLQSYGYNIKMDKNLQPLLKNLNHKLQILIPLLMFSLIIPLGYIITKEYKKVYTKVEKVSKAAEKVVEGDFSVHLKEEGEGDFNILNHQFNQMANRLENSLDILKKEKLFLKNTISDISHQLKTPLSSLIIFNDLLLENENMELEDRINFLEKAKSQLGRMEWLIINLLKIARIEAEAIEFKKDKVLLIDVVDIALTTLNENLKKQRVEIKGDLSGIFYGDKNWTGEAIINIVKNATEHGSSKIDIILEENPLFSSIIIKDNGEGIDEKHLLYIFERFYKATSEVKPESIGIGLNLAKLIIESQGGTISVKSKKGQGTEFFITFLKKLI